MCILFYETEELLERHVTSLLSLSARSVKDGMNLQKKAMRLTSVTGPGFLLYALQVFIIKLTGKKPGEVGLF